MALSSTSSLAQVVAAYDDNSDYDTTGNAAKCAAFIQACRILKRRLAGAKASGTRDSHLEVDPASIDSELKAALAWLQANDVGASGNNVGGPAAVKANFNNFRL